MDEDPPGFPVVGETAHQETQAFRVVWGARKVAWATFLTVITEKPDASLKRVRMHGLSREVHGSKSNHRMASVRERRG